MHTPTVLTLLQVLHLAEFLHNRPSDPICAKALWRRATARKVSHTVVACPTNSKTTVASFRRGVYQEPFEQSKGINTLLLELTASLTVLQELKHCSEASRDLQQALELEPANKTFAKELERLKQDCAEQRKQRAVLKQLHNVNSQSSNASAASIAKQTTGEQHGKSFSAGEPVKDLQRVQQLMQALHVAGRPHSNPLPERALAAADTAIAP